MRTAFTRCDVVVVALCVALVVMTAGAVREAGTEEAFRQTCGKNLSTLGKAMLIYANDYDDELPKAGGRDNEWVPTIPNWLAPSRQEAFGIALKDRTSSARITTTSSLYLLVKYAEVVPGRFVCPSEPDTRPFSISDAREKVPEGLELIDVWDFGGRYDDRNNPSRHCSYSYHMAFDKYALTVASSDPGMAILADRNPWIDPNRAGHASLGWARFAASEGTDPNRMRIGNSDTHRRDGQNVLFLDSHVAFETRPTCGVARDNIYAFAPRESEAEKANEAAPKAYDAARPAHRRDSVLVQELPFALRKPAPEDKREGQ